MSMISWPTTVAPMTVLATANVGLVSLACGSNTDELYIEKSSVKEVSLNCWKTAGGREMDTSSWLCEVALAEVELSEKVAEG